MSGGPVVFVVDDDAAVRESLEMLIESVGHTVQTFASAVDFLEAWTPDRTGCLVLDVRMPGMSGLELQQRLKEKEGRIPIIFITGHGDVPMAVSSMKAGAVDFIQKPFRDQELLDRIAEALDLGARAFHRRAMKEQILERAEVLTPREYEVMERVVAGDPNKAIAAELGLSERTVEVHRAHVMAKMRADSLPDLVRMVMQIRTPGQ